MELPEIQESQYYLIFVDSATGILVDQNGEWHTQRSDQILYTILHTYTEAECIVKSRVIKNPNLEGSIFDSKHKFIKMFYVLAGAIHVVQDN